MARWLYCWCFPRTVMAKDVFIASLDVGTTTIRCFIFDEMCNIKGSASCTVELISDEPGFFEIDPERLWLSIKTTIINAVKDAKLKFRQITCLSISTQRCSFITWDKITNEYFHNFITWKDLRADKIVKKWNSSLLCNVINKVSYCLYFITRSKRFLAGSVLKLMNSQVTPRLLWQIQNNSKLKLAIASKTALFGTLDSWLLYKLRKGDDMNLEVKHITDITSATATGLFDPFTLSWAKWAFSIFSIQVEMLPKVVENSYDFGIVHKSIFGQSIKITSSLSDQSAAMFGSCCFNDGDVKLTLGTGSFLNLNTNRYCHASVHGLYPLVAWRFLNHHNSNQCLRRERDGTNLEDLVYCVEGAVNDTGSVILWAMNFGLFNDPSYTSDIAFSVQNTDGVYFIPAFSGLGPPINDNQAATGFLGIRPSTTKAHLIRAILESIVFRVSLIYGCILLETNYKLKVIRVDGGVSKNDFICQMLADITGVRVERAINSESSVLGAAFVAGLNEGIWKNRNELLEFRKIDRIFTPAEHMKENYLFKMKDWERAVERLKGWYGAGDNNSSSIYVNSI